MIYVVLALLLILKDLNARYQVLNLVAGTVVVLLNIKLIACLHGALTADGLLL
jgi:hypothetical protein